MFGKDGSLVCAKANCKLAVNNVAKTASLYSTCAIHAGSEIAWPYGKGYIYPDIPPDAWYSNALVDQARLDKEEEEEEEEEEELDREEDALVRRHPDQVLRSLVGQHRPLNVPPVVPPQTRKSARLSTK